ncbi:hypothetical protein DFW101_2518 [Solidesulfovibrio carbinoliphilus subsp. oakridgensis]|uniref:Uncharacterized protein n=1 Tax=Solidesulfovibrio carbinoliphilus subsp. oakridgensis TaxID=694327 RepID=G7Q739_9BACT|nr:hypothetical protein [Solidesulfovibrio carbinoliphilus]EHJ48522.1 hypothetical protein DFW101_2518 [Solidesulfovibrio carbinoliphilus subsp. oakridgensis]
MNKWHKEVMQNLDQGWTTYLQGLEQSLDQLDRDITETAGMADACTDEWCQATEHVLDDLTNYIFSIHEPRNSNPENTRKIKELRRRVHELYAKYKSAAERPANV